MSAAAVAVPASKLSLRTLLDYFPRRAEPSAGDETKLTTTIGSRVVARVWIQGFATTITDGASGAETILDDATGTVRVVTGSCPSGPVQFKRGGFYLIIGNVSSTDPPYVDAHQVIELTDPNRVTLWMSETVDDGD